MHQWMGGPDGLPRWGKRMMAAHRWALGSIIVLLGVLLARDVSAWGTLVTRLCVRSPSKSSIPSHAPSSRGCSSRMLTSRPLRRLAPGRTARASAREHFVNLPRSAAQLEHDACPSDVPCVVTAIAKDFETLARPSAAEPEKRVALTCLGHGVGDVHQPRYVSFKDDRGGNEIDVQGPWTPHLHAVWDTCLIAQKLGTDIPRIAAERWAHVTEAERAPWTTTSAEDWANESFALTTAAAVPYCLTQAQACWYDQDHET